MRLAEYVAWGCVVATRIPDKRGVSASGWDKGTAILRIGVVAAFVLSLSLPLALGADYADGRVVESKTQSIDDALKVWRVAAWQNDDLFAEVKLGAIYADRNNADKGRSYYDPEEAYIWYFMATRADQHFYSDDGYAGNAISEWKQDAQANKEAMYALLTLEQKMDARARIIYILAGRGAEGFLSLAQLHKVLGPEPAPEIYACVYRPGWWRRWMNDIWRFWHPGIAPKRFRGDYVTIQKEDLEQKNDGEFIEKEQDSALCKTRDGAWRNPPPLLPASAQDGANRPQPTYSVIVRNNEDALMYAYIAQKLEHPLAASYAYTIENDLYQDNGDAYKEIKERAKRRADLYTPPFEFYPGATAGDTPHSDERLPGFAERQALQKFQRKQDRAYAPAIMRALFFTGHLSAPPKRRPGPADIAAAISDFQKSVRFDATGRLTPGQAVRLIQTAALYGDSQSQDALGVMYAKDEGVQQNFPRAERWFLAAARQQNCNAMRNLYFMYEKGVEGVPQDQVKAGYYKGLSDEPRCKFSRDIKDWGL